MTKRLDCDSEAIRDRPIEVTQEMIDAGLEAWRSLDIDYHTGFDPEDEWLCAIFRNMERVRIGEG